MNRLRFGTYLAPNILPVYQAVTEAVGRRLGIETELVVETDYESCAHDRNEVCFVCSLPYVEFERRGLSAGRPGRGAGLEGERYGDRPIYFSDVIVPPGESVQVLPGPAPPLLGLQRAAVALRLWHHPLPPRPTWRDAGVLRRGHRGGLS